MAYYKMLAEDHYERLSWPWLPANIHRIGVKGDGSCYFHSILRAFNRSYINQPQQRTRMCQSLRHHLTDKLAKRYPQLGGGIYNEFISADLTLSAMSRELNSSSPVGNQYQELVSEEFDLNIYMLDATTQSVYHTADATTLYRDYRDNVVLLYLPGHYECVGAPDQHGVITGLFDSAHPLIQAIKNQLK